MTGFCEEVGYFRMCSNHASEIRLLRSSLLSCEGAVRRAVLVDENHMVQESARVNLAESFLRGVVGKLPERSAFFSDCHHAAGARKLSGRKSRRDIRDRGGCATSSCARKSFPPS